MMICKEVFYTPDGAEKSPMDVLHRVMGTMDITGFERTRTSIFEAGCSAKIEYEKRGRKRRFHRTKTENLVLELSVAANGAKPGVFKIYSKLEAA